MTRNDLLDSATDIEARSNTKWVKGELLDTLAAEQVDPKHLLEDSVMAIPFNKLSWFQRVARHWQGDFEPLAVRAWSEGQHCWLFLARQNDSEMTALANWYTLAFRPVWAGDPDPNLLSAIAKRMSTARSVTPCISLAPVPRADGTSDMLVSTFRKAGWIVMRHQSSTSWTANVEGKSFADYWASRPSQLRNTAKRKAKKSDIDTVVMTAFDADAWAGYEAVYGASWKSEEGAAAFLREMAEAEGLAGSLRLGIARHDGQIIAAQFWTVNDNVAYIHKLAHNEDFRELSPGTILSAAMFRHVIDNDKVSVIDFGTGNDAYKADWMDRSDPLDTIRLFKKTSLSGITGAARARISALVRKTALD
jgi:Acetyltransferase (GNAT) domain